ncbi:hypothetical protein WN943_001066 [Citrus x changshan-huyou]
MTCCFTYTSSGGSHRSTEGATWSSKARAVHSFLAWWCCWLPLSK